MYIIKFKRFELTVTINIHFNAGFIMYFILNLSVVLYFEVFFLLLRSDKY